MKKETITKAEIRSMIQKHYDKDWNFLVNHVRTLHNEIIMCNQELQIIRNSIKIKGALKYG